MITYRSNHTPRSGPRSLVMSHDQHWFGAVATSSGRTRAGWAAWALRSRSSPWALSSRYMVEIDPR